MPTTRSINHFSTVDIGTNGVYAFPELLNNYVEQVLKRG